MNTAESRRLDLYNGLSKVLGEDRAETLMAYLPTSPGNELATKTDLMLWVQSIDSRFDRVDDRFAQIDDRFAQIDDRFAQIDDRFAQIEGRFIRFDDRFTRADDRFDSMNKRLDQIVLALLVSLGAIIATVVAQALI